VGAAIGRERPRPTATTPGDIEEWIEMTPMKTWTPRVAALVALAAACTTARGGDDTAKKTDDARVSYYKQVRPVLQANCQGCHQPAKAGGRYVMTEFARLVAGGESKQAAVVPGKPEESFLVDQITPQDGKAEMPQGKPPLAKSDLDLISRWIAQGAVDDTPSNARATYDADHLPTYSRPPVIGALDFSPDGKLLAVAGFHEVLLWKADGSEPVARLVGLSERIESLRFSPDGTRLAVTGGLPARMGEVQVWDVAKKKLTLSVPVTYDTVYGASWSPDGTRIAFGCADNSVRAIDAKTGEQVLFMGSHNDWALDTVFSKDGSHLMSLGRDMTAKLTEVATQRFVDNITSITPGALKGGLASVARHPGRDEIVVGGSDGVPKVYRVFRLTARVIGDDSNLIREFPAMAGRVHSVAISGDGRRIAAGSSLDGAGAVNVYSYEFDTALPDDIKAIMSKVSESRSPAEKEKLRKYQTEGAKLISKFDLPQTAVYAVAFRPDGKALAASGADGVVRLIEPESGSLLKEFVPVPIGRPDSSAREAVAASAAATPDPRETAETEALPPGARLVGLQVQPEAIKLGNKFAYVQLLVTAKLDSGDLIDVTRMVEARVSSPLVEVRRSGLVRPKADGQGALTLALAGRSVEVPVSVAGLGNELRADFVRDVAPVLSKLGCNAGTCHGSAQGKNGFKLSLRGYDPIFDVRALTDDHASRRVNLASPDDSVMLLKPTGAAPHVGGVLMRPGEPYYELLRNWIAAGARLDVNAPKVAKIELSPANPTVQKIGAKQQVRVLATYADGEVRDVTREAFVETGNGEVATADRAGLMTSLRRGEAPILARFEGAYAATTLTVMGDRDGFVWEDPPAWGKIDELVAGKWRRLKIKPSGLCTDAEFIRRVYLDLTGLPPSPADIRAFLADSRDTRVKRDELVEKLIGSKDFVEYWTNKWADLLQVNRKFLGVEGAVAFRKWIREQVDKDVPYDQFVRSVLVATGSNKANPAASYFKILREPAATMENTTQLFLGIRFNCNKCHDHPFERWTQDQYYQTAAYFAQVGLNADPNSGGRTIGGTAVEGAKPLYEEVVDKGEGEVVHDRTKKVTAPKLPYTAPHASVEKATRRQELAAWLTSKDNPYFARSYVNRLWGYLLGVGIIEPLDDIRAGNPPTNPELLDYLTDEFVRNGFDARHVVRLICKSRAYQLSVSTNKWNADDKANYSHATARRLPAEVLYDAVYRVTGAVSKIPGVPPGTRAAELPDSEVELPSGFFTTFGRPARESACECERSSGLQLGPVMALVSGPTVADAIADTESELTRLVGREADDAKLVDELFLRILARPASRAEVEACLRDINTVEEDHNRLAAELGKREVEFALTRPKLEREREAAVNAAKAELAAYEKELTPRRAEQEKAKAEQTAKLEKELKDYEATLPAKVAEWEKAQSAAVRWRVLEPQSLQAGNGAKLTKEADGSVTASGPNRNGVVTIVAETELTDITGLRLEVLPDDRLPSKGPGRAPDGNFVLTEIEVTAAPKADPKAAAPVKLQTALADFSQQNFPVSAAADGDKNNQGTGWAVSPVTGLVHWATFEPAEPVGRPGGTVLTIKLHHFFNGGGPVYTLGRFRLSATRLPKPVGLGLAEPLREVVAVASELRTDAQRNALLAYHRGLDGEWRRRVNDLNASRAPLPEDPRWKELRDAVASASKPVPVDPRLVQLRQDVEMSVKQAAARRLTAAQDIAWALINSPAFLFNH
jgi:WD40 repeat protein/mono/diheme cytochrome c family protein